jgi:hypothetical protein
MITKNNNFLVKSLTKNLVNNQNQDSNKNLLPKKNGNMYVKLNSKSQEQQQILQQQNQEQHNFMQMQKQRIQHQQLVLQKEQDRLIQQQQEQQRILQEQTEQKRILHQQQEQQRILQHQFEQQRILQQQQEQQRVLHEQLEQQRILQQQKQEQQRIIQQQQEQQRILQQQKQEQQRIIQQQQEQQRILHQQQEQQRILQQQQEQQRILQQQQEQQRILQQHQQEQKRIIQQQQEQQRILQQQQIKQPEINITQPNLNLPLFGKNKKTNERGNINIPQPQTQQLNNNISTFSSALSDYKTKKNMNKGTFKMDIMNDDGGNDFKKTFQNLCLSNINIFPMHLLQNVSLNGENEAILIEFRILPHVEFIIKNAIIKLGDSFAHTIVCGNENYLMIKQICDNISPNINIIKLEKNNITINEYNNLFYDLSFWERFRGNKLLFYQEDTIIFKNNINDFLQYDYVGAPWNLEPTPNFPSVGNGGFSLRNRNMLMDILRDKGEMPDVNFVNKKHKSGDMLENIPEDIFFSLSMLKLNIGNVPDPHVASYFSTENIVNKNSLGGHQFWLNDKSWTDRMNALFQEYRQ